jgi:hypothetical protein
MKQFTILFSLLLLLANLSAQVNCNNDSTAPIIGVGNPIVFVDCDSISQPSATVYDYMDPNPVLTVSTAYAANVCDLITSLRPPENLCNYSTDWAIYLANQPTASRYYQVIEGSFVPLDNGTVHVFMTVRNAFDSAAILEVSINLVNKMNWYEWYALGRW